MILKFVDWSLLSILKNSQPLTLQILPLPHYFILSFLEFQFLFVVLSI